MVNKLHLLLPKIHNNQIELFCKLLTRASTSFDGNNLFKHGFFSLLFSMLPPTQCVLYTVIYNNYTGISSPTFLTDDHLIIPTHSAFLLWPRFTIGTCKGLLIESIYRVRCGYYLPLSGKRRKLVNIQALKWHALPQVAMPQIRFDMTDLSHRTYV